jgi:hypothetical protein
MSIPFVPDDRLARFRALDERAMAAFCDIHAPGTGTVNPDGSTEPGADVVTSGVSCRIVMGAAATETLIAMRLTDVASGLIVVPVGTALNPKDRIVVGSAVYEVMGTDGGKTFATNLTAAVRDIT